MEQDVIVLKPATATEGIEIFINNRPFTTPMGIRQGGQVRITYKRNGLDGRPVGSPTMYTQFIATESKVCEIPELEWYKLIRYQMVEVKGEDGQQIPYTLWINDKEVNSGYGVYIREIDLTQVKVKISAEGWRTYEQVVDLTNTPLRVTLYSAYEDEKKTKQKDSQEEKPIQKTDSPKEDEKWKTPEKTAMIELWKAVLIGIICFALGLGLGWRLFAPSKAEVVRSTSNAIEETR